VAKNQIRGTANAAFRFVVSVGGKSLAAFTQCTLPTMEWEVQQVKEGGLNTFVHQLPGQRKPGTLQLANGVGQSSLVDWYLESMSGRPARKTITISLLNVEKKPVITWQVEGAFPTKWQGPQFKSDAQTVAIQTLELACGQITASYE
jgi:phage tail-like protein